MEREVGIVMDGSLYISSDQNRVSVDKIECPQVDEDVEA